jgi:hypothetical protein
MGAHAVYQTYDHFGTAAAVGLAIVCLLFPPAIERRRLGGKVD